MRLKEWQINQILGKIGEYEGYKNLKPFFRRSSSTFISSTGDILILRTTGSIRQKDRGSFCEIMNTKTYNYLKSHNKGSLYIAAFFDGKMVFFKKDIKDVMECMGNFNVDAKGRYLGRIWLNDAMEGYEFITIDGAYNKGEGTFVCEHIEELDDDYKEKPHYCYLMTDSTCGATKIGIAVNPSAREATLMSQKPSITLWKVLKCKNEDEARTIEADLHLFYRDYGYKREDGKISEWFVLSDEQINDLLGKYDWKDAPLA